MKRIIMLTVAAVMLTAGQWTSQATRGPGWPQGPRGLSPIADVSLARRLFRRCLGHAGGGGGSTNGQNQTHLGLGRRHTRVTPIQHQYQRAYPGPTRTIARRSVPRRLGRPAPIIRRILHPRPVVATSQVAGHSCAIAVASASLADGTRSVPATWSRAAWSCISIFAVAIGSMLRLASEQGRVFCDNED